MKPLNLLILCSLCLFSSLFAGKLDTRKISLEDFFRNPENISFKISYDGRHVAYLSPWENRLNVFVRKIETDPFQLTHVEDQDILRYVWANNCKIVYLKDNHGDENHHLNVIDISSGIKRDLTPFEGVKVIILDPLKDNDEEVLVGMNLEDHKDFDVYRINVNTGAIRRVAKNPGGVISWGADHNGVVRVGVQIEGVDRVLLYRENETESFEPVVRTNFRDSLDPIAFTFDNKYLYVSSNLDSIVKLILPIR